MKGSIICILLLIVSVICPAVYMQHVFVYGTLKKGQPNYFRMKNTSNGQAEFLAHARTVDPYPLVIATNENIPFLLNKPGTVQRVYGEIYRVDQKMLDFLDEFEECPKMYQRTRIQLEVQDGDGEGENTLKSGSIEEAFVYSTTTYESEWLQKPTYESYDTNGDHGLKYIDSDMESTPDTSSSTQQNTVEPIIIRDIVYTGCGTVQCDNKSPTLEYNIPFLLNMPGTGQRVYSEIYRVDQKMLDFLDRFKHCPQWYQRTRIQLEVQDGDAEGENTLKPGSIEEAFVYRKTTYEPEWLQKSTYESYDVYRDHGLKYCE